MNDKTHDAEYGRQRGTIPDVQKTVEKILNLGQVLCYLDQVNLFFNLKKILIDMVSLFCQICIRSVKPLKTSEASFLLCLFVL